MKIIRRVSQGLSDRKKTPVFYCKVLHVACRTHQSSISYFEDLPSGLLQAWDLLTMEKKYPTLNGLQQPHSAHPDLSFRKKAGRKMTEFTKKNYTK